MHTYYALSIAILFLLVGTSSTSVATSQTPLQHQDQSEEVSQKDFLTLSNETLKLILKPSLVPSHNGTASLRASNQAAATTTTCKNVLKGGTTTRTCTSKSGGWTTTTISKWVGHTLSMLFCFIINGIPCRDSYFCGNILPNGSRAYYLDCRNTLLGRTACPANNCQGQCLTKLTTNKSFGKGKNGCTQIGYGCVPFYRGILKFQRCTYYDMVGDGRKVDVKWEWLESPNGGDVLATINGSPCDVNRASYYSECRNKNYRAKLDYDCSNLSLGPCAIKICGEVCVASLPGLEQGASKSVEVATTAAVETNAENTSTVTPNSTTGGPLSAHSKTATSTGALLANISIMVFLLLMVL